MTKAEQAVAQLNREHAESIEMDCYMCQRVIGDAEYIRDEDGCVHHCDCDEAKAQNQAAKLFTEAETLAVQTTRRWMLRLFAHTRPGCAVALSLNELDRVEIMATLPLLNSALDKIEDATTQKPRYQVMPTTVQNAFSFTRENLVGSALPSTTELIFCCAQCRICNFSVAMRHDKKHVSCAKCGANGRQRSILATGNNAAFTEVKR